MTWIRTIAPLAAAFVFTSLLADAASTRKSPTARKSQKVRTKSSSGRKVAKKKSPPRQQTPSQERYREIQQALADQGYFTGEVNGIWNTNSVEALKRFQADKSLVVDGKLGSLTIIALGLGPQRTAASSIEAKPHIDP